MSFPLVPTLLPLVTAATVAANSSHNEPQLSICFGLFGIIPRVGLDVGTFIYFVLFCFFIIRFDLIFNILDGRQPLRETREQAHTHTSLQNIFFCIVQNDVLTPTTVL